MAGKDELLIAAIRKMNDRMELRTLRVFVTVAEEESFTRAAARLLVAQPAVSQQIRSLERELGEQLFERTSRKVQLTEAGRVLLPLASRTLAAAQEVTAEFTARAGLLTGTLSLGTVDGVEHTRLPDVLGKFHRLHPGVAVDLADGRSAELIARVEEGTLDAAVLALPEQPLHQHLCATVLLDDEITAVVPAGSSLAGRSSVPVEMLAGKTLITYGADSGLRARLETAFELAALSLNTRYATNDVALHVALVKAGIGIALSVRTDRALVDDPGVAALPLHPPVTYQKALVWRTVPQVTRQLKAFLAILRTEQ
ncbi:LysR family transcriptional regulator [Streptomyces sp. NPDC048409]|uniref:LysR family transcriptional regulator n=1 Tax=Streptomyces sp. NPDC048409 TaxID=3154723 RepID=UPI0034297BE2